MKMIFKRFAVLVVLCLSLSSCKYGLDEFLDRANDVSARSAYLTDIAPPVSGLSGSYTVLVMSDIHFGANPDTHPDIPRADFFRWLDDANHPLPKFCLCLGDLVESGAEDEYKDFAAFAAEISARGVPVYSIVGNHDLYNNGWRYWKEYANLSATALSATDNSALKTSYYRFQTDTFSWYFLDSASGTLGGNQLRDFVRNARADSRPKLVFTHYPIYAGGGNFYFSLSDPHERAILLDTFAKTEVRFVGEGHQHPGSSHDFGSFKEVNVASFRDYASWHLMTVNETAATVTIENVGTGR
jgi:3',5'-cyclic AMP phosphodiesterase CpdA